MQTQGASFLLLHSAFLLPATHCVDQHTAIVELDEACVGRTLEVENRVARRERLAIPHTAGGVGGVGGVVDEVAPAARATWPALTPGIDSAAQRSMPSASIVQTGAHNAVTLSRSQSIEPGASRLLDDGRTTRSAFVLGNASGGGGGDPFGRRRKHRL